MITAPDFKMKQIIFASTIDGDSFKIRNDNLVVFDSNENVKLQVSCYRLFMINIIGNCSFTSVLIDKAKKFGFYIAIYSSGFHLKSIVGGSIDGNTLLKRKQYQYDDLSIAKLIVKNKIATEYDYLNSIRNKEESIKELLQDMKGYYYYIDSISDNNVLLAYEGLAAKRYFKVVFNNVTWKGRKPRLKSDYVNSTLDIGYTLLFNFIDALLCAFGFDVYCGVYHKQFYMRKSLVCDIVEPFRSIIDVEVRKSINLKEIKEEDFELVSNQYRLKWKMNSKYIKILMKPVIENKDLIFRYIQSYYRAFMKEKPIEEFPFVYKKELYNGAYKL